MEFFLHDVALRSIHKTAAHLKSLLNVKFHIFCKKKKSQDTALRALYKSVECTFEYMKCPKLVFYYTVSFEYIKCPKLGFLRQYMKDFFCQKNI